MIFFLNDHGCVTREYNVREDTVGNVGKNNDRDMFSEVEENVGEDNDGLRLGEPEGNMGEENDVDVFGEAEEMLVRRIMGVCLVRQMK